MDNAFGGGVHDLLDEVKACEWVEVGSAVVVVVVVEFVEVAREVGVPSYPFVDAFEWWSCQVGIGDVEEDGNVVTGIAFAEQIAIGVAMNASFEKFGSAPTGEDAVDARDGGDGVVNCMSAGVGVWVEFDEVREGVVDSLAVSIAIGNGSRCR